MNITSSELTKIQRYELDILLYIDELCTRNNIRYYLAYGSLLGAVRHGGFIPWDDDIDIIVPRPDYERLQRIFNEHSDSRYRLYSVENEDKWIAPLAKVIDTRTILHQQSYREEMSLGLYVDVFVLDGVPDDLEERSKFFGRLDSLLKHWSILATRRSHTGSGAFIKIIKDCIASIMRIGMSPHEAAYRLCEEAKRYDFDECDTVGVLAYHGYSHEKDSTNKRILGDGTRIKFEGHYISVPEKYEEYLENIYGDYMTLPPVEQRKPHHDYTLQFLDIS